VTDLTELDRFMARRYRNELDEEAIYIKVDYSLPAKTMAVSPDVFAKMKELSDVEQCKKLDLLKENL
jgi:hypothetical protein